MQGSRRFARPIAAHPTSDERLSLPGLFHLIDNRLICIKKYFIVGLSCFNLFSRLECISAQFTVTPKRT